MFVKKLSCKSFFGEIFMHTYIKFPLSDDESLFELIDQGCLSADIRLRRTGC
jgi:hypothetical protein